MPIVLANDASWSGWGWALCDKTGPIQSGHVVLKGRTWRWAALRDTLADLDGVAFPHVGLRVVVEVAPAVYQRGNQASVGQGLGQLSGAIMLWATRDGWGYPWALPPGEWRPWWLQRGARPKGREAWKSWARATVELCGWGRHLDPYPWRGSDGGACGDVAEAILIGVGAARRESLAPSGPRRLDKTRRSC